MIRFGSWSTILAVAASFGALVAIRLATARGNRVADRFLAGLMIVSVLRLMPYVLGFAGFYDAYPWLSFAPFDLSLAVGPLLYLYVRALTHGGPGRGWRLHLLIPAVQLGYTLTVFSLPLAAKSDWNDRVHAPYIDPLETVLALASLGGYLVASWRERLTYERWLGDHRGDGGEHRQPWLRNVLGALGLWLVVTIGFDGFSQFVSKLNYYNRFPEYLIFSAIILWLGLEGWRYADHVFPTPDTKAIATDGGRKEPPKDWRPIGKAWAKRIETEAWWREPAITLAQIAQRLGTNETYVSRALNEGVGVNFNALINRFRVAAIQDGMKAGDGRDLLDLAFDAGFGSKASFNRAFREAAGMSPSAWLAAHIAENASS